MSQWDLKVRTKAFALRAIRLVEPFTGNRAAEVIARQLVRSATSVGANYRESCRARSPAEFIAKLGIVEEELDECIYWMELIRDTNLIPLNDLADLAREANELLAITVASIKTARKGRQ